MTATGPVAIDLDTLGDTRALWRAWLQSAGPVLGVDAVELPTDRGQAAAELDRRGAGNWRILLERYSEDRAPVYLRRDAETTSALRALVAGGRALGVFTDAPVELARIALAQLGAERRISALETGDDALARILDALGAKTIVVSTRAELLRLAA